MMFSLSMLLIAFCKPIPEDGRIELRGYHSSLRAPGLGSLSKVDRPTESRDDFKYMTPIKVELKVRIDQFSTQVESLPQTYPKAQLQLSFGQVP